MKRIRSSWTACILAMLLLAGLLLAFPGCGGGEPGVEELWEKSMEADKDINSYTMTIVLLYENTNYGSGQIETYTYDVNGNNVHVTRSVFGQTFSEIIIVGGTQYSRMIGQEEWTEQPAGTSTQTGVEQLGSFADLPNMATSSENLGLETVNGQEAYRLSFTLAPDDVTQIFRSADPAELQANSGGTVDVWVQEENDYRIKYEAVVRNVMITNVGNGDRRLTIDITNINQPININPPQ